MKFTYIIGILRKSVIIVYVTQNTNGARPLRKQLIDIKRDTYGRYSLSIRDLHSPKQTAVYKQLNKGDKEFVRVEKGPHDKDKSHNERAPKYTISGINLDTIT